VSPSSKQSASDGGSSRKKSSKTQKTAVTRKKVAEVTIPRETLVRRVNDARRASMVVLGVRTLGGGFITLLLSYAGLYLLSIFLPLLESKWISGPLTVILGLLMIIVARFASSGRLPDVAAKLSFLKERAFVWVDPFRDEPPHFGPLWVDSLLWAPTQVLKGVVPFRTIYETGQADAEAAADVARRMVEEGEIDYAGGLDPASLEAKGVRLLLLLRLARLVVDGDQIKGRVSGLGQSALFG